MPSSSAFPPFVPHPLVRGGHAQTIVGAYWPLRLPLTGTVNHKITMPDGDVLVLHDDQSATWQPGQRAVLLIHGLGGGHDSPYCARMAARLVERGVRTFRLDQRGCGAGAKLARYPGHAGRSEDARAAIEQIALLCPGSLVSAIGYSLGGNIVLKLAGECGDQPPGGLDQIAAVCPPIDLARCCDHIGQGPNWMYDRSFLRRLMAVIESRASESPEFYVQTPLSPRPRKLYEFDDRFTAPLSGFAGGADYYARCSAAPLLKNIRLPTLIIAAKDDPLIPAAIFDGPERSESIDLYVAGGGGHLGFIARGGADSDRRWLDWRLLEWLGLKEHFMPLDQPQ
jgi:predicted alpha/beta-fold hydrolase